MSKSKIEFDYNGTHYTLEHTAASLKKAEKMGLLQFGKFDEQILEAPEKMFKSLFICHHPNTADSLRHEIYNALTRTEDGKDATYSEDGDEVDALTEAVAAIINEAVEEIAGRGKQGNIGWKMTN